MIQFGHHEHYRDNRMHVHCNQTRCDYCYDVELTGLLVKHFKKTSFMTGSSCTVMKANVDWKNSLAHSAANRIREESATSFQELLRERSRLFLWGSSMRSTLSKSTLTRSTLTRSILRDQLKFSRDQLMHPIWGSS